MKSFLEDPVAKLQFSALRLRHLLIILRVYLYLTTKLDKLLNDFLVFGKYEGISNVLRNPMLLGSCQIIENHFIVAFQALGEFFLIS